MQPYFNNEHQLNASLAIANNKWVYWLDKNQPDATYTSYKVYVVVENNSRSPAFLPDNTTWYLDDETCEDINRKRGYDPACATEIVMSTYIKKMKNEEKIKNNCL